MFTRPRCDPVCSGNACPSRSTTCGRLDAAVRQRLIDAGERYLVTMFDSSMDLLPEFAGSMTYWLYHDNYLAAKLLDGIDDEKAKKIRQKIKSFKITHSGKIEIVFGEAKNPLPFRQFELFEVEKVGDKIVKSERVTDRPLQGWEEYGDLLALAVLANPKAANASDLFKRLLGMWDRAGDCRPRNASHGDLFDLQDRSGIVGGSSTQ